jgi:16S rRNA C1402 N4-methylase RsmH
MDGKVSDWDGEEARMVGWAAEANTSVCQPAFMMLVESGSFRVIVGTRNFPSLSGFGRRLEGSLAAVPGMGSGGVDGLLLDLGVSSMQVVLFVAAN